MIDTSRIRSGFDAELMLGANWFLTALQTLNANGALGLPSGAEITAVRITLEEEWDLRIEINNDAFTFSAHIEIENNNFIFTTDVNDDTFELTLPNFGQLAQTPILKKVEGDNSNEHAMALLINLNLRASPQNGDPLPNNEHLERGDPENAISFLPTNQDIALGIGSSSFQRFANNIWHTNLRDDEDGSHPLPDKENEKGEWNRINVSLNDNSFRFTLEGEVPIDLWPDADVSLELKITPVLTNGKLAFELETDVDIDTGLWGDVLAFGIGAVLGLLIGLFTGGILLLVPALGLGSIILLEIGEYVAGEVIERMILAKDKNGIPITNLIHNNGIVKFASPKPIEDSFSVGFLDAIPSSIPIFLDQEDKLHNHLLTVKSVFDDLSMNSNGLAVAGKSQPSEVFEPLAATITNSEYQQDELKKLTYKVLSDNQEVTLEIDEVFDRVSEGELIPPLKIRDSIEDPIVQTPAGRLCCPCLIPTHIRRENTIITRIKFSDGLELNTADAVKLQDSAGVVIEGLQLIHPANGNPYFRAPANETEDDNFESLPEF